jgi:hypothetical protein
MADEGLAAPFLTLLEMLGEGYVTCLHHAHKVMCLRWEECNQTLHTLEHSKTHMHAHTHTSC